MEQIQDLLREETEINQRYSLFLKTMDVLTKAEKDGMYAKYIVDMLPLVKTIIETYISESRFSENEIKEYVHKYEILTNELLKYTVWLVGNLEDCQTVEKILDYRKVHLCGQSYDDCIDNNCDYLIICSNIGEEQIKKIILNNKMTKIIRYDFLRICAYQISPQTAYLDIKLREKIGDGVEGAVTGLSYEQRGINFDKIDRKIVCLAAPSQDLYLDYHNFLWLYHEAAVRRKGVLKYCIIGMDFYRLWYDLSLTAKNDVRMLSFYKRLRCVHNFHKLDAELSGFEEDLKSCEEIMIDDYMDVDFYNTWHPEKVKWEKTEEYHPTEETYEKDIEEIKRVFNKPYPLTFQENVGILERFLKFLYMHNIKTIVYIPPFPKIFNDYTPKHMEQKTLEVLAELKEKYDYDLLNLSNESTFEDRYFADWCHLNSKGADLVTGILNDYMKKVWGDIAVLI